MGLGLSGIARRSRGRIGGGCLAAAALLLLSGCGGGAAHPSPSASAGALVQQIDATAGFIISVPGNWLVLSRANDPGVQYTAGPDLKNFVAVRVFPNLGESFGPSDSQIEKQYIDATLAGQPINVLSTTQVVINGLPGWQYVYTFNDPKLGIGAHIHVFLFQQYRLHTIVFQALPRSNIDKLAPTFQKILNSYKALPLPSTSPTAIPTPTPTPTP